MVFDRAMGLAGRFGIESSMAEIAGEGQTGTVSEILQRTILLIVEADSEAFFTFPLLAFAFRHNVPPYT